MRETLACLIIDDPLLKPKYGCLDYEQLLKEMKAHNFFTEIAFIPWNYRRSYPETIRLLSENPNHYAICVHGCNHLGNEFGGDDYQHLSALSSTALWRMEEHKRLTGLPYEPVIVFPQGRFSSVAMKALKDQGYFAAFNSTAQATDCRESPEIQSHQPAIVMYHGFPLFLRRYPKERSYFIQDMEAGRPIIIVEHHGAFLNGYQGVTDLVDWINSLGSVRWTSLLNIAQYYLGRKAAISGHGANSLPLPLNAKSALRRDNYIETSNFLTKVYKIVRG